jgi:rhodanese-related sulfurtransferase
MKTISAREVRKLREAGEEFTLINTLDANHFAETKIPDALSVPHTDPDFIGKVSKNVPDKDTPVIVYCANINCDSSTRGAEKLTKAGYTNVMDMADGYQGWQQAFNEKKADAKPRKTPPVKRPGELPAASPDAATRLRAPLVRAAPQNSAKAERATPGVTI